MDALTVVSTALAAVAALLSAISALASWRSTRAVEADVALARAATRYELFRSFEDAYSKLYPDLWKCLGPWQDPVEVEPELRRCVHDVLQTLSSVYNAGELTLIEETQVSYLAELFLDWLRVPEARSVWDDVFSLQVGTWPMGFVTWVEAGLTRTTPTRTSATPS
jgi:hypothetical protein